MDEKNIKGASTKDSFSSEEMTGLKLNAFGSFILFHLQYVLAAIKATAAATRLTAYIQDEGQGEQIGNK